MNQGITLGEDAAITQLAHQVLCNLGNDIILHFQKYIPSRTERGHGSKAWFYMMKSRARNTQLNEC